MTAESSSETNQRATLPSQAADAPLEEAGDRELRWAEARQTMVEQQLRARGISDPQVLAAMARVPRHRFVPDGEAAAAYEDHPLPIGYGQTISQPYIVALMSQAAASLRCGRALDVGTGCGYQTAVLAELFAEVYSIEIIAPLAEAARQRLAALGYRNITVQQGDGRLGWLERAPFDAIVVAAAPSRVPPVLVEQLAPQGRLVIPVGRIHQQLLLLEKRADGTLQRQWIAPVAFVPLAGEESADARGRKTP